MFRNGFKACLADPTMLPLASYACPHLQVFHDPLLEVHPHMQVS
jgi:hypothetical protein